MMYIHPQIWHAMAWNGYTLFSTSPSLNWGDGDEKTMGSIPFPTIKGGASMGEPGNPKYP